jgi:hypothetical protein
VAFSRSGARLARGAGGSSPHSRPQARRAAIRLLCDGGRGTGQSTGAGRRVGRDDPRGGRQRSCLVRSSAARDKSGSTAASSAQRYNLAAQAWRGTTSACWPPAGILPADVPLQLIRMTGAACQRSRPLRPRWCPLPLRAPCGRSAGCRSPARANRLASLPPVHADESSPGSVPAASG